MINNFNKWIPKVHLIYDSVSPFTLKWDTFFCLLCWRSKFWSLKESWQLSKVADITGTAFPLFQYVQYFVEHGFSSLNQYFIDRCQINCLFPTSLNTQCEHVSSLIIREINKEIPPPPQPIAYHTMVHRVLFTLAIFNLRRLMRRLIKIVGIY